MTPNGCGQPASSPGVEPVGLPGRIAVVGAGPGEQLLAQRLRRRCVGQVDEGLPVDDVDREPLEHAAGADQLARACVVAPEVQRAAEHTVAHDAARQRRVLVDAPVAVGAHLAADPQHHGPAVADLDAHVVGHRRRPARSARARQATPIAPR